MQQFRLARIHNCLHVRTSTQMVAIILTPRGQGFKDHTLYCFRSAAAAAARNLLISAIHIPELVVRRRIFDDGNNNEEDDDDHRLGMEWAGDECDLAAS